MSYIGYLEDRKKLEFSCIEEVNFIKKLLSFTNTFKNAVSYIIKKNKQTVILIFSKEVLVAVLILFHESIGIFSQSKIVIEQVNISRGGGQSEPTFSTSQFKNVPEIKSKPQNYKTSLEPKKFQPGSNGVKFKPGNGNPGGNGNDDYDLEIGTKNWEKSICPNPDEIISIPELWNTVQNDPETCLNEEDEDYLQINLHRHQFLL